MLCGCGAAACHAATRQASTPTSLRSSASAQALQQAITGQRRTIEGRVRAALRRREPEPPLVRHPALIAIKYLHAAVSAGGIAYCGLITCSFRGLRGRQVCNFMQTGPRRPVHHVTHYCSLCLASLRALLGQYPNINTKGLQCRNILTEKRHATRCQCGAARRMQHTDKEGHRAWHLLLGVALDDRPGDALPVRRGQAHVAVPAQSMTLT